MAMQFANLPIDVLTKIIQPLGPRDVLELSVTSKELNDLHLLERWLESEGSAYISKASMINQLSLRMSNVVQSMQIPKSMDVSSLLIFPNLRVLKVEYDTTGDLFPSAPPDSDQVHLGLLRESDFEIESESEDGSESSDSEVDDDSEPQYQDGPFDSNLGAIAQLPALQSLQLVYATDPCLQSVGSCVGLTSLSIVNGIEFTHLSPLAGCRALSSLSILNGHDLTNVAALADCAALSSLTIESCHEIEDFDALANCQALTSLSIINCGPLRSVDAFARCEGLLSMTIDGCPRLMEIRSLPPALQQLDIKGCVNITSTDGLANCQTLTRLVMRRCQKITSIETLPSSLQNLDISDCDGITSIDSLARCQSLARLDMRGCRGITSIELLPTSIQHLYMSRCEKITRCDRLADCQSLIRLYMKQCGGVTSIPLPSSLRYLAIRFCEKITSIDGLSQCRFLSTLKLNFCGGLTSVALPSSLQDLDIGYNDNLTRIDGLATCQTMSALRINSCDELESIGTLPSSLHVLSVSNCDKLTSIDGLASCQAMHTLNVTKCGRLTRRQTSIYSLPPSVRALGVPEDTRSRGLVNCQALTSLSLDSSKDITQANLQPPFMRYFDIHDCGQGCTHGFTPVYQNLNSHLIDDYAIVLTADALPPELQRRLRFDRLQILMFDPLADCRCLVQAKKKMLRAHRLNLELSVSGANLSEVYLAHKTKAGVPDLEPLVSCKALRRLHMAFTPRSCNLEPLTRCRELRVLELDQVFISSVADLGGCQALHTIKLTECYNLTSIAPLAACASLKSMDVRDCYSIDRRCVKDFTRNRKLQPQHLPRVHLNFEPLSEPARYMVHRAHLEDIERLQSLGYKVLE